jgi:hypothetical protein
MVRENLQNIFDQGLCLWQVALHQCDTGQASLRFGRQGRMTKRGVAGQCLTIGGRRFAQSLQLAQYVPPDHEGLRLVGRIKQLLRDLPALLGIHQRLLVVTSVMCQHGKWQQSVEEFTLRRLDRTDTLKN